MKEKESPINKIDDDSGNVIRKEILIVGDWVVDEHWVAGVHRSLTSSRVGQVHFRALHNSKSTIHSFCGAGRVASLLYQFQEPKSKEGNMRLFDIFGIGLWNDEDTYALSQMFDFTNLSKMNHFKLTIPKYEKFPEGVYLFNIEQLLNDELKARVGTTQVIRIYTSVKPGDAQYFRIDFESGPQRKSQKGKLKESPTWTDEITLDQLNSLKANAISLPDTLDAVVIKDLNKGVISSDLIRALAAKYGKRKQVKWFVSTKSWMPSWFEILKRVDLRLLIVPQIAAQEAIRQNNFTCWINRSGYPDELVFKILEDVKETVKEKYPEHISEDFKIIVLPDGFSAIGFEPYKDNCLVQPESSLHPALVSMGMASVFLPGIVGDYLKSLGQKSMKDLIQNNLRRTYNWVRFESERLVRPEDWSPTDQSFIGDIAKGGVKNGTEKDIHLNFLTFDWKKEKEFWEMSMEKAGIINIKKEDEKEEKYLELWRSMVEVDGYVCCVGAKRQALRQLILGIETFCKGEKKYHVGGLIISEPGSGKTYLVRKLAESLNLRFLPFNVTLMHSRSDILDCFDAIGTTQAQNRKQPILVFIDEINSTVGGDNVYDAFLAPIEDGIYVRGGKEFHIDPCIWIFAGTEGSEVKSAKRTDFISRLSMGEINMNQIADRAKVENVYLGICLLRNEFPDVRSVSEKVLEAFQSLKLDVGVRRLKHFVKSFNNIQYGKVVAKNVPIDDLKKICQDSSFVDKWKGQKEGDLVLITDMHH